MKHENTTTRKAQRNTRTKAVHKSLPEDPGRPATHRFVKTGGREFFRFPEARGKTVEEVALSTSGEHSSIRLRFRDNTGLSFAIEPRFIAYTEFFDVHSGETRILKEWRPIRSGSLRLPLK